MHPSAISTKGLAPHTLLPSHCHQHSYLKLEKTKYEILGQPQRCYCVKLFSRPFVNGVVSACHAPGMVRGATDTSFNDTESLVLRMWTQSKQVIPLVSHTGGIRNSVSKGYVKKITMDPPVLLNLPTPNSPVCSKSLIITRGELLLSGSSCLYHVDREQAPVSR